jgi:hypothetical protein
LALGQPEREGQRDQSLLCTIVQVSLDAPPLRVARLDDPRARCRELLTCLGVGERVVACPRGCDRTSHSRPPALIGAATADRIPRSRSTCARSVIRSRLSARAGRPVLRASFVAVARSTSTNTPVGTDRSGIALHPATIATRCP